MKNDSLKSTMEYRNHRIASKIKLSTFFQEDVSFINEHNSPPSYCQMEYVAERLIKLSTSGAQISCAYHIQWSSHN